MILKKLTNYWTFHAFILISFIINVCVFTRVSMRKSMSGARFFAPDSPEMRRKLVRIWGEKKKKIIIIIIIIIIRYYERQSHWFIHDSISWRRYVFLMWCVEMAVVLPHPYPTGLPGPWLLFFCFFFFCSVTFFFFFFFARRLFFFYFFKKLVFRSIFDQFRPIFFTILNK
jgi:hypothetical protein